MPGKLCKIETFIPESHVDNVLDALNDIGALTLGGNYDYCVFRTKGIGSWRPLEGADPFLGTTGELCKAEEIKIEFTCKHEVIQAAVDTIEQQHPYEEVVINILPVLAYENEHRIITAACILFCSDMVVAFSIFHPDYMGFLLWKENFIWGTYMIGWMLLLIVAAEDRLVVQER